MPRHLFFFLPQSHLCVVEANFFGLHFILLCSYKKSHKLLGLLMVKVSKFSWYNFRSILVMCDCYQRGGAGAPLSAPDPSSWSRAVCGACKKHVSHQAVSSISLWNLLDASRLYVGPGFGFFFFFLSLCAVAGGMRFPSPHLQACLFSLL